MLFVKDAMSYGTGGDNVRDKLYIASGRIDGGLSNILRSGKLPDYKLSSCFVSSIFWIPHFNSF